jgi:hypothetical protein
LKFLATLLLLIVPLVAAAQLVSNPNPPVPAAQAVGGAYTAAANGAEALYWNPSGLAYGTGSQGRFAYQQIWGASFLTHLAASGYTTLPRGFGGIGLSVQNLGTRDGGATLANENEVALGHGFLLQHDIHSSLAFGYTLKMIQYSLGESVADLSGNSLQLGNATAFGLDVGATAQLWDRFRLAGAFKNINNPQMGGDGVRKRDLPRMLSAGVAYTPYYAVRTTFDLERIIYGETQFKAGLNAQVVEPLDLRVGVITNPNSFTAGFGFHWRELVLDYAFMYHPVLSPSHLIGIGFNLDQSLAEIGKAK